MTKASNGLLVFAMTAMLMLATAPAMAEQRDKVAHLRGPYNTAFFDRHRNSFQISAALHFSHAKQHDVLLLTPFERHETEDVVNVRPVCTTHGRVMSTTWNAGEPLLKIVVRRFARPCFRAAVPPFCVTSVGSFLRL